MLFFRQLMLTQFRNYVFESFTFTQNVVGISGANGSGKTNLLDAIHYLCFTKSYFSKPDTQSVYQNLQGFRIQASISKNNESNKIVCILRENNGKEFQMNSEVYKKFSEHIGKFPCVFNAPDDVHNITESSSTRK